MKIVHIAADATLAEFLKTTKYSQSSFPSNICLLLVGEVPKGALARRVSRAETYYANQAIWTLTEFPTQCTVLVNARS